jgi:hypothetical protein
LDSLLDQAAPTPAIDRDPASANASASADADASEPERAEAEEAGSANPGSGGCGGEEADLAEQAAAGANPAANQPEPPTASDQAG